MPLTFIFLAISIISVIINSVSMSIIKHAYKIIENPPTKDKFLFNIKALSFAKMTDYPLYLTSRISVFTFFISSLILIIVFFIELYNLIF